MNYPTNLAGFKRFMGDGGVLTLEDFEIAEPDAVMQWRRATHKRIGTPRVSADNAQGSILVVVSPDPKDDSITSRLMYGPAKDWTFEDDLAVVNDGDIRLTYRMSSP